MILHKERNIDAIPFFESLVNLSEYKERATERKAELNKINAFLLEKYSFIIQTIIAFEEETKLTTEPDLLAAKLNKYLKKILPVKDSGLLLFDSEYLNLIPINKADSSKLAKTINGFYKEGVLNMVFDSDRELIVPDLESYDSSGSKLNYLIVPIKDEGKNEGVLALLTPITKEKLGDLEKKSIRILLNSAMSKIEKANLKEKLNEAYNELQTYQAKLSNDFRLAAIGELTNGIVEEIKNPMQVIISQLDLLNIKPEYKKETNKIKRQINKISKAIDRLVKFSEINHDEIKIQPCNINKIVKEYFSLVKSTLEGLNLEGVLDLENRIPSVLSHPNYIYQLLNNIFGLINTDWQTRGGVIIQTRYKNNEVILRIISTNELKKDSGSSQKESEYKINVNIISNLMKRHEGDYKIESFENKGSAIVLTFPLKRRIR